MNASYSMKIRYISEYVKANWILVINRLSNIGNQTLLFIKTRLMNWRIAFSGFRYIISMSIEECYDEDLSSFSDLGSIES